MTESDVQLALTNWTQQTEQVFYALRAITDKPAKRGMHAQGDGKKQRVNELLAKSESLINELSTTLIPDCESALREIPNTTPTIRAALEYLWIGRVLLPDPPATFEKIDQLYGLLIFVTNTHYALSGVWYEPCRSIASLGLPYDTIARLFLCNGIATVGDLLQALRKKISFYELTADHILECYTALMGHGVSLFPIDDSQQYWEAMDARLRLWKCNVNGDLSYFIELSDAQVSALAHLPSLVRLPNGRVAARLLT